MAQGCVHAPFIIVPLPVENNEASVESKDKSKDVSAQGCAVVNGQLAALDMMTPFEQQWYEHKGH